MKKTILLLIALTTYGCKQIDNSNVESFSKSIIYLIQNKSNEDLSQLYIPKDDSTFISIMIKENYYKMIDDLSSSIDQDCLPNNNWEKPDWDNFVVNYVNENDQDLKVLVDYEINFDSVKHRLAKFENSFNNKKFENICYLIFFRNDIILEVLREKPIISSPDKFYTYNQYVSEINEQFNILINNCISDSIQLEKIKYVNFNISKAKTTSVHPMPSRLEDNLCQNLNIAFSFNDIRYKISLNVIKWKEHFYIKDFLNVTKY